jgi:hypothetical protein
MTPDNEARPPQPEDSRPYVEQVRAAEREARRLAEQIRGGIGRWLQRHGQNAPVSVSGLLDSAGQPKVLLQMNSRLLLALVASAIQQAEQPPAQVAPPPPHPGPPSGSPQQGATPPPAQQPRPQQAPEAQQHPPHWPPPPAR